MCWGESASGSNRWPRMAGAFILRRFPSPTSTAVSSRSVPAAWGMTRKKPTYECLDEEDVESAVDGGNLEIANHAIPRFPPPRLLLLFFVQKNHNRSETVTHVPGLL